MTTPTMDPTQTMVGTSNGVGLWVAPERTAAPADIDTAFAAPWLPLGYASDDGVTLAGDTTTESFTPWQSRTPIRTVITEKTKTIGFTMWELRPTCLEVYFDQVIGAANSDEFDFEVRSDAPQIVRAVAVDAQDGEQRLRIVCPRATLESTGDMTLTRGAMVPLEVTLSALDDGGVMWHIYRARGVTRSESGGTRSGGRNRQTASAAAE